MKKIILATVLAGIGSTAALAADLGARTYTKAPAMMASVSNWTGLYIGGNVGYGWGSGTTHVLPLPDPTTFGESAAVFDTKPKGVIGGAQIGYNWQMGSIVTGLEADMQGSGIKGTAQVPIILTSGASLPSPAGIAATEKLSWFGTVRGRLGVTVMPDLLLYATGGLAYGQMDDSADRRLAIGSSGSASASQAKVGWAAGAGGEWMFARNWSAKVEYIYLDLGRTSAIGELATPDPVFKVGYTWKNQDHIVRAGVNYHF
jgi:outer membrane immunogenic protein